MQNMMGQQNMFSSGSEDAHGPFRKFHSRCNSPTTPAIKGGSPKQLELENRGGPFARAKTYEQIDPPKEENAQKIPEKGTDKLVPSESSDDELSKLEKNMAGAISADKATRKAKAKATAKTKREEAKAAKDQEKNDNKKEG